MPLNTHRKAECKLCQQAQCNRSSTPQALQKWCAPGGIKDSMHFAWVNKKDLSWHNDVAAKK
jgi:hypothetical protein